MKVHHWFWLHSVFYAASLPPSPLGLCTCLCLPSTHLALSIPCSPAARHVHSDAAHAQPGKPHVPARAEGEQRWGFRQTPHALPTRRFLNQQLAPHALHHSSKGMPIPPHSQALEGLPARASGGAASCRLARR